QKEKRRSGYYRCNLCGFLLRYYDLEDRVVGSLMHVAGDEIVHRKVVRVGDQRTAERYDLIRQIDTLKQITDADASAVIAQLEDKLRKLTDSIEPGIEVWEPTGLTVAQYWETLDRPEQGEFLRSANVHVDTSPGKFKFRITEAGVIQMTHLEV